MGQTYGTLWTREERFIMNVFTMIRLERLDPNPNVENINKYKKIIDDYIASKKQ